MTSVPATELVHCSQLRVGDLITEATTPSGPFYPVLLSAPGLLRIDGRAAGQSEALPLDLPVQLTSGVLRLMPSVVVSPL